ncbi:MAG: ABC transporter ATP-binding protein [Pseudarcicella sp.]|nr:ABC transporter ATP-binding protein [Pseudarcicella sp.]MBP6410541.1 ABC transporter ATP-binding protein [Pseudarcicella sp.]
MKKKGTQSGNVFDLKIIKRIYGFLKPYQLRFWLLVFLIMLMACVVPLNPLLIRYTIDHYIAEQNQSKLLQMFFLMIAVLLVQGALQFVITYNAGWLGQTVIRDIRVQLYQKILSLKLKFFDDTPIGRLVTRTVSDVETLNDVFSEGLAAIAGDILQLLLITAAMFWIDWRLTVICLCTVPFMLLATYIFKEHIKKSFNEVRTAVANLNTFVQEHITGMNIVQIFNAEKQEYDKFYKINETHRDANIKSIWAYSVYFPVVDVILASATALIVWFGAKHILLQDMTVGTLTAFIMFMNLFFKPIRFLADRFNTLQMGIVSTERIITLLDSKDYVTNNGSHIANDLKGQVVFKNVWFAYLEDNYVLKNISFEVQSGKTIALVGATGAGKSSTINLLSRLYEINKGQICIDGIDLHLYDLFALRKQIGVVLQDVFLFSDSIQNNISLGDESITLDKIKEAAKLVGADDFIMNLPGNYQYNVMERGATLSVGQRQLISFVRVLVHDPKIIVLDEATSSIDSETEILIQNAIEKMMKGRTAILIAHRLSTIQKADEILVLDKGEIKEKGSHHQLLLQKGYYAELYNMQFESNGQVS